VLHFDSIHFPTTDVVAERSILPFADECFAAFFSFSVLERLKDPMNIVAEMKRVLKEGGEIQVSAPHLIQYHGHPDHYFKLTFRGLQHLLGDDVEVELDETPQWDIRFGDSSRSCVNGQLPYRPRRPGSLPRRPFPNYLNFRCNSSIEVSFAIWI